MTRRKRVCRIELTQRVLADLREIERFSMEQWGRTAADRYLDEFAAVLDR
ncbi:MAG: type II toxin-antitoxin system RelE/ParE family toxin [Planctomycetes bacterium]|nr:type II toxin-antitoxin system RelE/ParE family toxin [Planctomycetota bacterium]